MTKTSKRNRKIQSQIKQVYRELARLDKQKDTLIVKISAIGAKIRKASNKRAKLEAKIVPE